jgi:uncharacterized cupredoxin-like copper-binding protein
MRRWRRLDILGDDHVDEPKRVADREHKRRRAADDGVARRVTIEDANGNVIGQSKVIANGTAEVRFLAESDTYTFYCSVDGHREAGMEGTLTLVNP